MRQGRRKKHRAVKGGLINIDLLWEGKRNKRQSGGRRTG